MARSSNSARDSSMRAGCRSEIFPPAQAAEAHRRLEKGSITGKLVLTIP